MRLTRTRYAFAGPHLGHTKSSGQRSASSYRRHAASSGNIMSNSGHVRGNVGSCANAHVTVSTHTLRIGGIVADGRAVYQSSRSVNHYTWWLGA